MLVSQPANKNNSARFILFPPVMTVGAVLGTDLLNDTGRYGPALCLGMGVGALLFMRGAIVGGRLGNARLIGRSRAAVSMRLGACLALAGIAAGAQGHDFHWTRFGHAAIGLGQLAVSLLAMGLAVRQAKAQKAKENEAAESTAARQL